MDDNRGRQLDQAQSTELFDRIMKQIGKEQKKSDRIKSAFFGATFALSLILIVPAFNLLRFNFAASGFMDYFSLMFSDSEITARYWRNFIIALLEVLPVMSLAAFLTVVFVLLESLKHLASDFSSGKIRLNMKNHYGLR